jgi:hypothetical protein
MTILTKEQWETSVAEAWSDSIKATYQHLIDEAVKAEREACAKVCEEYETNNDITATWLNIVAEAIRARGQA